MDVLIVHTNINVHCGPAYRNSLSYKSEKFTHLQNKWKQRKDESKCSILCYLQCYTSYSIYRWLYLCACFSNLWNGWFEKWLWEEHLLHSCLAMSAVLYFFPSSTFHVTPPSHPSLLLGKQHTYITLKHFWGGRGQEAFIKVQSYSNTLCFKLALAG